MTIFASHGNSCRVSGSGFEYEGYVFFFLFLQNETRLSSHQG